MDHRIDFGRYLGRPYEELNCWQLVREFYRNEMGIDLPSYSWEDAEGIEVLVESNLPKWTKHATPGLGDVALFWGITAKYHVGVVISPLRMLHTAKGEIGAHLTRLENPVYHARLIGYYSYVG